MMVEIEKVLDHSLCASPNLHLVGGWLINAQKKYIPVLWYCSSFILFSFWFILFYFNQIESIGSEGILEKAKRVLNRMEWRSSGFVQRVYPGKGGYQ